MKTIIRNALWIVGALAVVALVVYAFLPTPMSVDVATVSRGPLRVTVDEDGKTRVKERFLVSAPLTGRLLRIALKAGDRVEAGATLLATIEPTDPGLLDDRERARAEAAVKSSEAARDQANSRIERCKKDHENSKKDLMLAEKMRPSGGISQQELNKAQHMEQTCAEEMRAAKFALRVAEFELEQAQTVLLRSKPGSPGEMDAWRFPIKSPVNGRVLRVHQESTMVVTPGLKLIEVGDPEDLEVEVDLLSADAVKVQPGAKVFFEHWGGGEALLGRVRLVEPSGFLKLSALGVEEQRVNVIMDIVDPLEKRKTLGDGFRVEARVVVWEEDNVLKIPAGALFRRGAEWLVFVVEDAKAVARPVKIGHNNGQEAEVLDGLGEGQTVIVHPSDKIKEGVGVIPR